MTTNRASHITPESIRQQKPGHFPGEVRPYHRAHGVKLYNEPPTLLGKPLCRRERDVLAALGEGLSNKAIGYQLGIAEGTVKMHLWRAARKTGYSTRIELALSGVRRENALLKWALMTRLREEAQTRGRFEPSYD